MRFERETLDRLMIEKQLLDKNINNPSKQDVFNTIDALGCLQIDTISVVERAHYLTLWSRLGNYEKTHLDTLAYKNRRLFEYWAHAACYIPMEHYRYYVPVMKKWEKEFIHRLEKRTGKGKELVDHVIQRITEEGALSSKDISSEK